MPTSDCRTGPTDGPIALTFFRFVIPSVLSLLSISTATVVDGFFVGNYLGADALAAVNLLMPYLSLLFGIALMLAVGGSVKAGIYISEKNYALASEVFSKTLICVFVLNVAIIPAALVFNYELFSLLGATPDLHFLMSRYFGVFCVTLVVQLCGLVLYYFVRADNHPALGMQALMIGGVCNVILDALFICAFEWGMEGAALATLVSQCIQLVFILRYFRVKDRHLSFFIPRSNWKELWATSCNGFSEFINEMSAGLVILVIHWVVSRQSGVEGIAAFSVVNYLIYVSLMVYYGIVDSMHILLSQNMGAGLIRRVNQFMQLAGACIAVLSIVLVAVLHVFQSQIISFFLDGEASHARALAETFIRLMWPLFLFNGFNILVSAYLTSAEKALHSSLIALSRSLLLPVALVVGLDYLYPGATFLYALPLAEVITFLIALVFLFQFRPTALMPNK